MTIIERAEAWLKDDCYNKPIVAVGIVEELLERIEELETVIHNELDGTRMMRYREALGDILELVDRDSDIACFAREALEEI